MKNRHMMSRALKTIASLVGVMAMIMMAFPFNAMVSANTPFVLRHSLSETNHTNGDVTIFLTAADFSTEIQGIYLAGREKPLSQPGEGSATFAVSKNGTYTFTAKDGAETATADVVVDNIDKTAPANVVVTQTQTASSATLAAALQEDGGSPISILYKLDDAEETQYTQELLLSKKGAHQVVFIAQDAAGNRSAPETYTVQVGPLAENTPAQSPAPTPLTPPISLFAVVNQPPRLQVDDDGTVQFDMSILSSDTLTFAEETPPINGTIVLDALTKTVTYIPNPANTAQTDSFVIKATEADGTTTHPITFDVDIYATPLLLLPTSSLTTTEDIPCSMLLSTLGASDVLSRTLTWSVSTLAAHGVATISADGLSAAYTPGGGYVGGDSFVLSVSNGKNSATALIDVTVDAAATIVAKPDAVTIASTQASITVDVIANDETLIIGETLKIRSIATMPTKGTASITSDGKIEYVPDPRHGGTFTVDYTVGYANPLLTETAQGTLTITVQKENANTIVTPAEGTYTIAEDDLLTFSFTIEDVDTSNIENNFSVGITSSDPQIFATSSNQPAGTVVKDNDDKTTHTYTWQPEQYANGTVTITISVTDTVENITVTESFSVVVDAVNNTPVITPDFSSYTINEDAQVEIEFEVFDPDIPALDQLVVSATSSEHSVIETNALTVQTLVPATPQTGRYKLLLKPKDNANSIGGITITLTAKDEENASVSVPITLVVTPVNDAPKAVNDAYTILEDELRVFEVLLNDTDVDIATNSDVLTLTSLKGSDNTPNITVTTALGGTAAIDSAETKVSYTPPQDISGIDSFTYTITDKDGLTATAKVTITITPVNDLPVFSGLSLSYPMIEDTEHTIEFTVDDVETAAASLTVSAIKETNASLLQSVFVKDVSGQPNQRRLQVVPALNQHGTATIKLVVSDGEQTATVFVKVVIAPVNDAPMAVDDSIAFTEDTPVTFTTASLLANDGDVDIATNADVIGFVGITVPPLHGTLAPDGVGGYAYTPAPDWDKNDSFTYTIKDTAGLKATAVVTLVCTPDNDAPTIAAVADQTMDEDGTLTVSLVFADPETTDPNQLVISLGSSKPDIVNALGLTLNKSTGVLTIKPLKDKYGDDIIITVMVSDGDKSVTTTFKLTVNSMPDAPVAKDDEYTANDDSYLLVTPLNNDYDVDDGDTFTITAIDTTSLSGTLTDNNDGTYTYISASGFKGTETIPYTITDSTGETATATIIIVVSAQGIRPTIAPVKSFIHYQGTAVPVTTLTLDNIPASETYTLSATATNTALVSQLEIDTQGAVATGLTGPTQPLQITLATNANGETDIIVTLECGGNTDVIQFHVVVWGDNEDPVAVNDTYTKNEHEIVTFDVLDNDTDKEDKPGLRIVGIASPPSHGTALITSDNKIEYGPHRGDTSGSNGSWYYNGPDSFTYTIVDSGGRESTATVGVTITPVNDVPVAHTDTVIYGNSAVGTTILVPITDNDTDYDSVAEKGSILIESLSGHSDGVVSADNKQLALTPTAAGWYDFTYSVSSQPDDSALPRDSSNTASVWVGIQDASGDVPPRLRASSVRVKEDCGFQNINLTGMVFARNTGTSPLTFEISELAGTPGLLTAPPVIVQTGTEINTSAAAELRFTPAPNAFGKVTFNIIAKQGSASSAPVNYTIYVDPVNDAPKIESITMEEGTALPNPLDIDRGETTKFEVTITDPDNTPEQLFLSASSSENAYIPSDTDLRFYKKPAEGSNTFPNIYILEMRPIKSDTLSDYRNTPIAISMKVSDGFLNDSESITLYVKPKNTAPTAKDYVVTIDEDTLLAQTVIEAGSDPDNDALTIICDGTNGTGVLPAGKGTLAVSGKQIRFTPAKNDYTKETETIVITYRLKDSALESNPATITITINPVNDAPEITGVMNPYMMNEDDVYYITFTARDVDEDLLVYTATCADNTYIKTVEVTGAAGANGTYTVKLKITPQSNAYHPLTPDVSNIVVTASDPDGESATETIALHINPVNDAPQPKDTIVEPIALTTLEDTPLTLNFDDYYKDVDGDSIKISELGGAQNGTIVNVNNKAVFTPTKDYFTPQDGTATPAHYGAFAFIITDEKGGNYGDPLPAKTVTINIAPVNDAPVAKSFTVATPEDTPITIGLFAHVSDVDNTAAELSVVGITTVGNGTATVSGWDVQYTPSLDWNGTTTFTYTVRDTGGQTDTGTVTINVTPVDDDPRISFQRGVGDAWKTLPSLASDTTWWEMDEDTPTTFDFRLWTPEANANILFTYELQEVDTNAPHTTVAKRNKVTTTGTGEYRSITINPELNKFGKFKLVFTVSEGSKTITRSVFVEVRPVNDLPVLTGATTVSLDEDTIASNTVSATDIETAPASLVYSISTPPTNGTAVLEATTGVTTARWTYTPHEDFNGTDSFQITVADVDGGTHTKQINLTITPVNDVPGVPSAITMDKTQYADGDTAIISFTAGTDKANETPRADLKYDIEVKYAATWTTLVLNYASALAADDSISYAYPIPAGTNVAAMQVRVRTVDTEGLGIGTPVQRSVYVSSPGAKVDGEIPVLTSSTNPVQTTYTKGPVTIVLNASDPGEGASGVQLVEKTSVGGGTLVGDYVDNVFRCEVTANGTYDFKVTDKVGKINTHSVVVANVDRLKPSITATTNNATGTEFGKTQGSATDIIKVSLAYSDASATAVDGKSGIDTQEYVVAKSLFPPSEGWLTYAAPISLGAKGQWYVHTRTTDKAGNDEKQAFGPYVINNSLPTVTNSAAVIYEENISAAQPNSIKVVLNAADADKDTLTYHILAAPPAQDYTFERDTTDPSGKTYILTHKGTPMPASSSFEIEFKVKDGDTLTSESLPGKVVVTVHGVNDLPTKPQLTTPTLAIGDKWYKAGEDILIKWTEGIDEETAQNDLKYMVQYQSNNGSWTDYSPAFVTGDGFTYRTPNSNDDIKIRMRTVDDNDTKSPPLDNSLFDSTNTEKRGMSAWVETPVIKVDNAAPTISLSSALANGASYTPGDNANYPIEIVVVFSDARSLPKSYQYAITNTPATPTSGYTTGNVPQGESNMTLPSTFSALGTYYYHISVEDYAGYGETKAFGPFMVVNTAPIAQNKQITVNEGASVTIQLSGQDGDPGDGIASYAIGTQPNNAAALTPDPAGKVVYQHDGSSTPTTDTVTFTVTDTRGVASKPATVSIVVLPVNDAPQATITPPNNLVSVNEDSVGTMVFVVSDEDDPLGSFKISLTSDKQHLISQDGIEALLDPVSGEVTVKLTPLQDVFTSLGEKITITIVVEDPSGAKVTKTFEVEINPVNDAPIAKDLYYLVKTGGTITGQIVPTDVDTPISAITYAACSGPGDTQLLQGTATVNTGGSFSYNRTGTDDTSFADYFKIEVNDQAGGIAIVTVYLLPHLQGTEDIPEQGLPVSMPMWNTPGASFTISSSNVRLLKAENSSITAKTGAPGEFYVNYVPEHNQFGTATLTVNMFVNGVLEDTTAIDLKIRAQNDAPDCTTTSFDAMISAGVVHGTIIADDREDGVYAATSFGFMNTNLLHKAKYGTVDLNAVTGAFTYTPDPKKLTSAQLTGLTDSFVVTITEKGNNATDNPAPNNLPAGVRVADTDDNLARRVTITVALHVPAVPSSSSTGSGSGASSSASSGSGSSAGSTGPSSSSSAGSSAGSSPASSPSGADRANAGGAIKRTSGGASMVNDAGNHGQGASVNAASDMVGAAGGDGFDTMKEVLAEDGATLKKKSNSLLAGGLVLGAGGGGIFIIFLMWSRIVVRFYWKDENGENELKFVRWFARLKSDGKYELDITKDEVRKILSIATITIHFSNPRFGGIAEKNLEVLFDKNTAVETMPVKNEYKKKAGVLLLGTQFNKTMGAGENAEQ